MSFSDDLRNELAAPRAAKPCDRLAELSGLFHTAGSVHLRGRGEVALHLDVASSAVARRAFRLLRSFGVASELRTYRRRAFDRATRYQLHLRGDARSLQVLHEAGVLGPRLAPSGRPPKRVVARRCCRSAYLRGALLGAGSLSGPRRPHLEIRVTSVEGARFLAGLCGGVVGVLDRGRHAIVYAKGREAIADVLAAAGASDAVLRFEERAVLGETRARANRLANADHANLVRAGRAAHRQLVAARRLVDEDRLDELPPAVREAAELRLRYPSLALRDLARKCRPPVTKTALHRRLQTLLRLAER